MKTIIKEGDWQLVIVTNEEANEAYRHGDGLTRPIPSPSPRSRERPDAAATCPSSYPLAISRAAVRARRRRAPAANTGWYIIHCTKHKYLSGGYCPWCSAYAPEELLVKLKFFTNMDKV